MTVSNATLGKIAVGIAFAGSGALYAMRWTLQNKLANSVTYKEALEHFNSNKNAKELLGEPIKVARIDVGDNNCYSIRDNIMRVCVPLRGKERKADLIYWVNLKNPLEKELHVSRIELGVQGANIKRILLKDDGTIKTDEEAQ